MPPVEVVSLETHPSRYRHIQVEVEGPVARLALKVQEDGGQRPDDYKLKLNSYDISVDVELADAIQRLRFEHPQVAVVIVCSRLDGCFSAGANIFMLSSASHDFKVNFCKFTNETRLAIEDATQNSGQTYIAALNGLASGGGYELALACEEIYLVDDRRSTVALPEVPYLGVLPGTGGLTRVTDKRRVRRDRADVFCTVAEGVKGRRAVEWGLVDAVYRTSVFDEKVTTRARELAGDGHPKRRGVPLPPLEPSVDGLHLTYRHVEVKPGDVDRTVELVLHGPDSVPPLPDEPTELGGDWYPLRAFRELDDALCRLRFDAPEVGLVVLRTRGDMDRVLALEGQLESRADHWFVREVRLLVKRTLKRLDLTAKTFFALVDEGSCFAGTFFELALASDRIYVLDEEDMPVELALTPLNAGAYPMSNGLSRLETRFLGRAQPVLERARAGQRFDPADAYELGLCTEAFDELDWDDEIRLAIEERASFSPDALTGMEANLRFPGPETLETKIFGRLSAWQNWIFQRPNAVGDRGALALYGEPESPQFDWRRT
jgi:benzoyl-CoA-dihydrodiol lyase